MNILLIDTNNELTALKQVFVEPKFTLTQVNDPMAALKILSQFAFDVVISLASFTKVNGNELLRVIAAKHPTLVRMLFANGDSTANPIASNAHYVFSPPLNSEKIYTVIEKLTKNKQKITKDIIVKTVAGIKTLPSPPKVYLQLNAILKEANTDSQKIADIILQDPSLTAKVLQFSNSALMNKGKPLNSISDAITKMGIDTLCCIVMTAELFSYEPDIPHFSLIDEQLHCLATAKLAASIVKPELKQAAMLAGLLHDIGKIILFEIDPKLTQTYFELQQTKQCNPALENKVFGIDHCHVGAYLLHTWSFSYSLIEAIVLHHSPQKLLKKSFGVAHAVYLADCLLREDELSAEFVQHYQLDGVLEKLQQRAKKLVTR